MLPTILPFLQQHPCFLLLALLLPILYMAKSQHPLWKLTLLYLVPDPHQTSLPAFMYNKNKAKRYNAVLTT